MEFSSVPVRVARDGLGVALADAVGDVGDPPEALGVPEFVQPPIVRATSRDMLKTTPNLRSMKASLSVGDRRVT
jgi:hypothetical protein